MTIALAKYLVDRGLVSADQMDDALQRQVIFGGSVDTNLLEMDLLDEPTVMEALSQIHSLPMATAELLRQRDPRMPKLFPPRLAHKYGVVPVLMSGRSLVVLAATRIHPLVIEEINFMLSLSVKPYLVCEPRLKQLLQDWVGVDSEPRYQALAEKLGNFPDLQTQPEATAAQGSGSPAASAALRSAPLEGTTAHSERIRRALNGIEQAERVERSQRERARRGSMALREAHQACMQADSREELVDVILRFSRQFVRFVGLFVINNDSIFGWDAVGTADAGERIRKIQTPIHAPSVLGMVVETRAFYLGPVQPSGNNSDLLQAMGRSKPRNVLVLPITVRDRLIGLLYGDAGQRLIRGARIQELLVFVSNLSGAFGQLLHKIKKRSEASLAAGEEASPARTVEMAETAALRASGLVEGGSSAEPAPVPEELETEAAAGLEPVPEELETETAAGLEPVPEELKTETAAEPGLAAARQEPAAENAVEPMPAPGDRQPAERLEMDGIPEVLVHAAEAQPLPAPPVRIAPDKVALAQDGMRQEVDLPAAPVPEADEHKAGESRVRLEDLGEEGVTAVVDTERDVVVVEGGRDLPPEPEQTARAIEGIGALDVVERERGLGREPMGARVVVEEPRPEGRRIEKVAEKEIEKLVQDLISGVPETAALARERLVAIGPAAALTAVMEHFPGRLRFGFDGSHDTIPPVEEHGELLAYLVELDTDACDAVADRLEDADPVVRHYAVLTLGHIQCGRAVSRLAGRLYDREARVRLTAIDVLQGYRTTPGYGKMLKNLRRRLDSDDPDQQAIAAALLGNFKDVEALPLLVDLLRSKNKMVTRAAVESLSYITKQDFGTRERKWLRWWSQNKGQSRVQWLIAGLRSKNRDIRFSSAQELSKITQEYFGYYFDSSRVDREKAIRRWERWWEERGCAMRFEV